MREYSVSRDRPPILLNQRIELSPCPEVIAFYTTVPAAAGI
jgi:hypothetical protein